MLFRSDYNKVIELDPKKALAYLGKGAAKFALKDYEDAIKDLNIGLELRPNYPRGYYLRGVAKCELAQNESGCLDLNKARELGYSGAEEAINKYCNNLPYKKLYEELHKAEYYTKSEDEFYQQFGTPEGQQKLYKALDEAGYYTKSIDEFKKQFFGGTHFSNRDSTNYKFNSSQKSIYSFLKENNLTVKSEQDFYKTYSDSTKAKELYDFFIENKLTDKDFDTFYKKLNGVSDLLP